MQKNIFTIQLVVVLSLMAASCQIENEPAIADEDPSQEVKKIEFDTIQLVAGWRKNEPRLGDPDGSTFFHSPDATEEGVFTGKEIFGYQWLLMLKSWNKMSPCPAMIMHS